MLYPIRVDVSTSDNALRIIDTILIDPTCLPVPPPVGCILNSPPLPDDSDQPCNLEQETIRLNAAHLARALIADMEVEGMTQKSAKIGRLRLFQNESLLEQVQQNIEKQLVVMLDKEKVLRNQSFCSVKKRKRNDNITGSKVNECSQSCEIFSEENEVKDSHLVPIHIRIKENGICFTDQFQVDIHPRNEKLSNPISLASKIVHDMNLPEVMTQSIAISIAEQMHGLSVPRDLKGLSFTAQGANESTTPSMPIAIHRIQVDASVPTAWKMEQREDGIAKKIHASAGKPDCLLNSLT
jgi:SNF5 / SMARCB1 / INI1.